MLNRISVDYKQKGVQPRAQINLEQPAAENVPQFFAMDSSFLLHQLAIDSMQDGFILIGNTGLVVNANHAAARMLNKPRAEIIGSPISFPLQEWVAIPNPVASSACHQILFQVEEHIYDVCISPVQTDENEMAGYVVVLRDATEGYLVFENLKQLSSVDELTGILNRRAFYRFGQTRLLKSFHDQQELSLIFIDVDHFKQVNDSYGHLTGDQVLQALVQRLKQVVRKRDTIARYGGDEFLILLPDTSASKAMQVAQRICNSIAEKPMLCNAGPVAITVSAGVADTFQSNVQTFEHFVDQADQALYTAKAAGRNRAAAYQ